MQSSQAPDPGSPPQSVLQAERLSLIGTDSSLGSLNHRRKFSGGCTSQLGPQACTPGPIL